MSYQNYIDDMMQNHELNSESTNDTHSEYSAYKSVHYVSRGGNSNEIHTTGGFPPIFLCSDSQQNPDYNDDENSDKKQRQYTTHKNSVSIKQIIDKRKEVTPFIPFNGINRTVSSATKTRKN